MSKSCNNPDCYNYDITSEVFCVNCLKEVVDRMTCEDLYDMFAEGNSNFEEAIKDGEAHGLLTPRGKKAIIECKDKWFKLMNDILLSRSEK